MPKKTADVPGGTLRICTLEETWAHIECLMALANDGVDDTRRLALMTMDRYFERVDEAAEGDDRTAAGPGDD